MQTSAKVLVIGAALVAVAGVTVFAWRYDPSSNADPPSSIDPPSAPRPLKEEATDPIAALQETERLIESVATTDLDLAWSKLRVFGYRSEAAARRVNDAWVALSNNQPQAETRYPEWAGPEPVVALASTLLEASVGYEARMAELAKQLTPTQYHPVGLAWRIEFMTLLRLKGDAPPDLKALGSFIESGIKLLERGPSPASTEYARLAQALFRGAPQLQDIKLEPTLRRILGRLIESATPEKAMLEKATPVDAIEVERLAARLEAVASFAQAETSGGAPLDAKLDAALKAHREQLLRSSTRAKLGAHSAVEVAALAGVARALKLTRAVLGEPRDPTK